MGPLDRVVGVVGAWYVGVVMLASSCAVNLLQVATYLAVFVPGTRRLAWRQRLANAWWNLFLFIVQVWGGVRYRWHGDATRAGENAIMISNHERGLDFVNGVAFAATQETLGCGRVMSMMKDSLKWLPTIGWTNWLQGSLYLKRDWARDRARITQKLHDMESGAFPRPFYVGVYPEGTRITPKKHEASLKFARERGLPELQRVLLPRTKGFVFLKENLPTSVDCIYDITIAYDDGPARLSHALLGGGFRCGGIHLHVRRIPFDDLPAGDPAALEKWLMDAFVEKDKLLLDFERTGTFPGSTVTYPSRLVEFLLLFLAWSFALTAALFVLCASPVPAALSLVGAAAASVPSVRHIRGAEPGGDAGKEKVGARGSRSPTSSTKTRSTSPAAARSRSRSRKAD